MLVPRRVSAHHLKFSDACKTHTSFFLGPGAGARCCETSGAFCWHLLLVGWQRGCALGYAFRGAQKVNEKAEGWVLVLQQMCLNTLLILGTFITEIQLQNTKSLVFSPALWGCHADPKHRCHASHFNTGWPPRVRLRGLPFGAHEVRWVLVANYSDQTAGWSPRIHGNPSENACSSGLGITVEEFAQSVWKC